MDPPVDKYHIVYIILLIHGVGTLLPWNMFITANDYFLMKLTPDNTTSTEFSGYKDNFLSYVGIASKLPNTAVQLINFIIVANPSNLKTRILLSIVLQGLVFALTTALAVIETSEWIATFYAITMASIVLINVFNAVYQNCLFGQVALLPSRYLNAVMTGMNISGVVTSIFMIISIAAAPNMQTSAVIYFTTAVLFLAIGFTTYWHMMRSQYFTYFVNVSVETKEDCRPKFDYQTYLIVLKKTWVMLFNIFFTYVVTLGLFPALLAQIKSTSSLDGQYFSVVWCFLSFNLFAMIGNISLDFLPNLIQGKRVWIFVILRIIFIPFFVFCNVKADTRTADVWFHNDAFYIIGVVLLAVTHGYISSLAIVLVPKIVETRHASIAGMMSSFTVMLGIAIGISSSFLVANIV